MNFFDESKFFLKKTDNCEIVFNKNLSKNQKILLDIIISEMYRTGDNKISLAYKTIFDATDYIKAIDLVTPLEKISSFKIQAAYQDFFSEFLYISYTVIGSFSLEKNIVNIEIDKRFHNAALNKSGDIHNITKLIKFQNKHSLTFFHMIDKLFKDSLSCDIRLDTIKTALGIDDKYTRYYDIKTRILNPVVEDINIVMGCKIHFEELRLSASEKSKIIGIKVTKKNNIEDSNTLSLLDKIKKYIPQDEFDKNKELLQKYIDEYGYDTFSNNFNYALKIKTGNFLKTFKYCVKYNLCRAQQLFEEQNDKCVAVINAEIKSDNVDEFISKLASKLLEFEYYDYYDRLLAKAIASIKYTNILYYKSGAFIYFAQFNEKDMSVIKVIKCDEKNDVD